MHTLRATNYYEEKGNVNEAPECLRMEKEAGQFTRHEANIRFPQLKKMSIGRFFLLNS